VNQKKILFISSVTLSANPRIVKEIKLALSLGYDVSFIGFSLGSWLDELDEQLKQQLNGASFKYIDGTRKNFWQWLGSTVVHEVCKKLYAIMPRNIAVNAFASSKRTVLLNREVKQLASQKKMDLVLAHTLPCLYAAYKLKKNNKLAFAFDVEDYHPGEKAHIDAVNETKRRNYLFNTCLPQAEYVSCASPLIASYTAKHLKHEGQVLTINNSFPLSEFEQPQPVTGNRIQLVWFSQHISHGRGLEPLLEALETVNDQFHLTLIGSVDELFFNKHIEAHKNFITLVPPLPQNELHKMLARFDVGLALEQTSTDINRNIALTNKIIAYMQAGLYVLATDTAAQKQLLEENPSYGILSGQDKNALAVALQTIAKNLTHIRNSRLQRYEAAGTFSWEKESKKLALKWETFFNKG
jgi:glycosyltransferase involved in cell wall biosynthesis